MIRAVKGRNEPDLTSIEKKSGTFIPHRNVKEKWGKGTLHPTAPCRIGVMNGKTPSIKNRGPNDSG